MANTKSDTLAGRDFAGKFCPTLNRGIFTFRFRVPLFTRGSGYHPGSSEHSRFHGSPRRLSIIRHYFLTARSSSTSFYLIIPPLQRFYSISIIFNSFFFFSYFPLFFFSPHLLHFTCRMAAPGGFATFQWLTVHSVLPNFKRSSLPH
jgi:hypothetical protein